MIAEIPAMASGFSFIWDTEEGLTKRVGTKDEDVSQRCSHRATAASTALSTSAHR